MKSFPQFHCSRCFATVLALALTSASGAASAQAMGPGPYLGLGFGQSTMNDASTALLGTPSDDKDTAVKFYGGVMFNPFIGLELGFVDFGKFSGVAPREDWRASGVNFSVVGAVPVPDVYSDFSLFGKVGTNSWSVDDNVFGFGTASASGTSLSYGLGAELELGRDVGMNLQWERFADVGDPNITGRSNIDLITLNFVYHFRPFGYRDPYRYPSRRRPY